MPTTIVEAMKNQKASEAETRTLLVAPGADVKQSGQDIKLVLTARDLKWFKQMVHIRRLRSLRVKALYEALVAGKPFEAFICVNDISTTEKKRWRIIDGNHRIEAIRMFLEQFPDASIEVSIKKFRNLSSDEEAQKFITWNDSGHVSGTDTISVLQDSIPIVRMVLEGFPFNATIYPPKPNQKGLMLTSILRAYAVRNEPRMVGTDQKRFLQSVRLMDESDYVNLKQFAKDFIEAFGFPEFANPFSKNTVWYALMKIYFANAKRLGREEVVDRWKKHVSLDAKVRNWAAMGGRGNLAVVACMKDIADAMNRRYRDPARIAVLPESVSAK